MDELRRFFDRGGGLFDPHRDITPRQLCGLGLLLSATTVLGCLWYGLDPRIAFEAFSRTILIVLAIAILWDRN